MTKLNIGDKYYTPYPYNAQEEELSGIADEELFREWIWSDGRFDSEALRLGLVFLSKDDAVRVSRANLLACY